MKKKRAIRNYVLVSIFVVIVFLLSFISFPVPGTNYNFVGLANLHQGLELGGGVKNTLYTNCENHGDITATTGEVGGIIGEKYASATLVNCSNTGTIKAGDLVATDDYGTESSYVGYLVGHVYN